MANAITKRAYSAGHFELRIDGMPSSGHVKSVEGGWVKQNTIDEQVGADIARVKHATNVEVDPITIEVGMSQVDFLLHWINQSWQKKFARHNGMLIHADFNYKAQFHQEFFDALIEETAFPTLDASSKDALYLKVKLRPETVKLAAGDNHAISGAYKGRQKMWSASAFRLVIDGVETRNINKIEGFAVKQGIKPIATGAARFAQLEPTKLDFPDLKCHMSLQHASAVFDWYKKTVIDGVKDSAATREGAIEFLSQDRKDVLLRIKLTEVGIKGFNIPKSEANQDQIKRCSFDLYVGSMELEGDVRLGLE